MKKRSKGELVIPGPPKLLRGPRISERRIEIKGLTLQRRELRSTCSRSIPPVWGRVELRTQN